MCFQKTQNKKLIKNFKKERKRANILKFFKTTFKRVTNASLLDKKCYNLKRDIQSLL
jgi:hypothetical protein